jgi:hypothetical protein
MDAVHHVTYANVGHEPLDDLMAICDPCHAFLSAKSNVDPLTDGVGVYLAGTFTLPWRDSLIQDHADAEVKDWSKRFTDSTYDFVRVKRGLIYGFDVTGPWRVDTSANAHGLASHGEGIACACCNFDNLIDACKAAIRKSDIIFSWLPDIDTVPAGTLWEMGYASGIGKTVVVGRPGKADRRSGVEIPVYGEYWLPMLSSNIIIAAPSARDAWYKFCQSGWQAYRKTKIKAPAWEWRNDSGVNLNL